MIYICYTGFYKYNLKHSRQFIQSRNSVTGKSILKVLRFRISLQSVHTIWGACHFILVCCHRSQTTLRHSPWFFFLADVTVYLKTITLRAEVWNKHTSFVLPVGGWLVYPPVVDTIVLRSRVRIVSNDSINPMNILWNIGVNTRNIWYGTAQPPWDNPGDVPMVSGVLFATHQCTTTVTL